MALPDILFYVFSGFALLCGVLLLVSRNPVNSAMFLVLTIASLAGLFVLLHAFFLAAVQVLVYAGAVMVLFLFVIMLLDLKAEERRRVGWLSAIASGVIVVAVGASLLQSFRVTGPTGAQRAMLEGGTAALGKLLFTRYVVPFEIVSLLLLVAMVGVILLSKKDLQ
jgi:NADH-quinone oxidoreductase subunit J